MEAVPRDLSERLITRGFKSSAKTRVFGIAHNADDLHPRRIRTFRATDFDAFSNGIFIGEVPPFEGLINQRNRHSVEAIVFGKVSATNQRYSQCLKVIRTDKQDRAARSRFPSWPRSSFDAEAVRNLEIIGRETVAQSSGLHSGQRADS